jgi:hypothetical protein
MLEAAMTFKAAGLSVRQLAPAEMIEVIWHAYNPGATGDGGVREQRQRRFAEILDEGEPHSPYSATLTEEEIVRAVGESDRDPMALKRLLAPRSWEELDDRILVNDGIATTTYFVENFSYDLMPSLGRILGEYAGRLHVAMYVRAGGRRGGRAAKKGGSAPGVRWCVAPTADPGLQGGAGDQRDGGIARPSGDGAVDASLSWDVPDRGRSRAG